MRLRHSRPAPSRWPSSIRQALIGSLPVVALAIEVAVAGLALASSSAAKQRPSAKSSSSD